LDIAPGRAWAVNIDNILEDDAFRHFGVLKMKVLAINFKDMVEGERRLYVTRFRWLCYSSHLD